MIWTILAITTLTVVSVKVFQRLTCGVCQSSARLDGQVVILTGGTSGTGLETARGLAQRGARVIITSNSTRRGAAAVEEIIQTTGNTNVCSRLLDLSSLQSVRQFSHIITKTEERLDILINNASAFGLGNHVTKDGLQVGMQVNYFGPFLLTCLLLPLLKSSSPSRIINVSSIKHNYAVVDFDNLNMERYWSDILTYANSKLYLIMMTVELSRRLTDTGVTVNALHPGVSSSTILKNIPSDAVRRVMEKSVGFMYQNAKEASQTTLHLAVTPELETVSGQYFSNCRKAKSSKVSQDPLLTKRLWEETERLVGFSLPDCNKL
ncbi:retinol dehydrogenase 11-like [Cydia strobilella]|uniref:retinol dehydrogenase 11-like n=1 Tax=Cydia strobilella TaxID=1100964 RepID=UPI0030075FB3